MRYIRVLSIAIVLIAAVVACAGIQPPTQEQLNTADYGPYPSNFR